MSDKLEYDYKVFENQEVFIENYRKLKIIHENYQIYFVEYYPLKQGDFICVSLKICFSLLLFLFNYI